jgi:hypothetical protein
MNPPTLSMSWMMISTSRWLHRFVAKSWASCPKGSLFSLALRADFGALQQLN